MPIYAYKCAECGHPVEVLQKVSDPPLVECPNCHKAAMVKQLTAAGFQLKGSGWYVTDFRDKASAKKEATKTDGAAASKDSDSAPKTESPSPAPAKESTSSPPPPASPPPPSSSGSS